MKRTSHKSVAKIERGRMLATRLGLEVSDKEGHDLKGHCFSCGSSDAFRIHGTDGVSQCYSCGRAWSPFELARDVFVEDGLPREEAHEKAITTMRELGFFARGGNGHVDPVEKVAMAKGTTVEGLRAFGAKSNGRGIVIPVYGPNGKKTTTFTQSCGDKGRYRKGGGSGLFLPEEGRLPEPGEKWLLVEGVKDAAALYGSDYHVAGLPGSSLPSSHVRLFRGVHATIIPDRDRAGEMGARKSASRLYGVAASVRKAVLPAEYKAKGGADVRDVLKKANGAKLLVEAIVNAELVTEDVIASWDDSEEDSGEAQSSPDILRLSDVTPEKVLWLWQGYIPLGKLSLVIGDPNVGKSLLTTDIAARVSTGNGCPNSRRRQKRGKVVFLSAEDDPADTIRPRLDAAGADSTRIIALKSFYSLRDDIGQLEAALESEKEVRLVIIDPISAYLGGVDSHKNAEVRSVLAPLAELAQRYRVAAVCVSHLNKQAGGTAMYRAMGSLALIAAARAAFAVVKERNSDRRLFLPVKGNLGPAPPGLAYRIVPTGMAARIQWEPGTVNDDVDDLLQEDDRGTRRYERDETTAWLQEMLKDGKVKVKDLQKQAREEGVAWRTIRRAADELGVKKAREGSGPGSTHWWEL